MNYDKLQKKLKDSLNEKEIDVALVKISLFHPDLVKAFEYYIDTNEIPQFSFDGWDLKQVIDKVGCNELQAFFNMDILMKNDEYRKYFRYMNFGKK